LPAWGKPMEHLNIAIWCVNIFLWLLLVGVGCKIAILLSEIAYATQCIVDALYRLELVNDIEDEQL
jgi:hypothetical protein